MVQVRRGGPDGPDGLGPWSWSSARSGPARLVLIQVLQDHGPAPMVLVPFGIRFRAFAPWLRDRAPLSPGLRAIRDARNRARWIIRARDFRNRAIRDFRNRESPDARGV